MSAWSGALYCHRTHEVSDALVGSTLCLECYDYDRSVIWNASAGKLSHICVGRIGQIGRELAKAAGIRRESAALREVLRVSYVKVVEYQRRSLVHFHAAIRLDRLAGAGMSLPPGRAAACSLRRSSRPRPM